MPLPPEQSLRARARQAGVGEWLADVQGAAPAEEQLREVGVGVQHAGRSSAVPWVPPASHLHSRPATPPLLVRRGGVLAPALPSDSKRPHSPVAAAASAACGLRAASAASLRARLLARRYGSSITCIPRGMATPVGWRDPQLASQPLVGKQSSCRGGAGHKGKQSSCSATLRAWHGVARRRCKQRAGLKGQGREADDAAGLGASPCRSCKGWSRCWWWSWPAGCWLAGAVCRPRRCCSGGPAEAAARLRPRWPGAAAGRAARLAPVRVQQPLGLLGRRACGRRAGAAAQGLRQRRPRPAGGPGPPRRRVHTRAGGDAEQRAEQPPTLRLPGRRCCRRRRAASGRRR
jgi:hypothetical protein